MGANMHAAGREPPNSVSAEHGVLAALLQDNSAWTRVAGRLADQHFFRHENKLVYGAIQALISEGADADPITVFDRLQALGSAAEAGGMSYVQKLFEQEPGANLESHIGLILDRAERRARIASHDRASEALFDCSTPMEVRPATGAVVLLRGSDMVPEPVNWLWPYWLARGKLHILAGAPGQGKTTLAGCMAATVTTGSKWPDGSRCDTGNALIWSGEDDPKDTLLPRLMAAGADVSRVFFVTGARIAGEVVPFDPARDMAALAAEAMRIGGVNLLVVDPVVSAIAGDGHKNTEVRRGLQPLVDLAASLGAAVLGISHFTKGSAGRDPTERVTGSVAFGAVARVVLVAAKVKGEAGEPDRRVMARSKSNIGPDDGGFEYELEQVEAAPGIQASRVTWGEPIEGTAREILAEPDADDSGASASDEAMESLRNILGRDVVPSKAATAAMTAEGYSKKVIRRAREKLGVVVTRGGFGKEMSSYWKLPHLFAPSAAQSGPSKTVGANGHDWGATGEAGVSDVEPDPVTGAYR